MSRPFHVVAARLLSPSAARLPRDLLLPALQRFDKRALLETDVVGHFVDRLDAIVPGGKSPSLEEAASRARRGEPERIPEALGSAPDADPRAAFLRGIGHLARGDLEKAEDAFRASVSRASNLLPAMVCLGACHAASGLDREAVGAWQTALISESASPALLAVLVDALLRLDEAAKAVAVAEEALESWPEDDAMQRRLGLALARSGKQREALAVLRPRIERHPDDAGALLVALHLLFHSLTTEGDAAATAEQRQHARAYARAYLAAGPTQPQHRAMVARWLRFLEKSGQ